jgi:CRISPR-associated protein Cas5d
LQVVISADRGHFQRPGNPGEPSTYPVIPPTAVEGIIAAVYWHPGQSVQVRSISLLNKIEYTTETVTQFDHQNEGSWLRTYELVVNPCYLVNFRLEFDRDIDSSARIGQLTRRLLAGEHYFQPSMGISDFPATVKLLAKDDKGPKPIDLTLDLGRMPHYWIWEEPSKASSSKKTFARRTTAQLADRPMKRVVGQAKMFEARMEKGQIVIPPYPPRGVGGYAN